MPQFRFYFRGDTSIWLNDVHDLPTAEAARQRAVEVARNLSRTAALSGIAGSVDQRVEVVDEAGEIIFVVPVGRLTNPPGEE